jgi:hypothetical protein
VIVSIHLADVGPLKAQRAIFQRAESLSSDGMLCAEPAVSAPLGTRIPRPRLGRLGLIAAWEDDAALDRFLASHPLGRRVAEGWHVRLQPLRCFGAWPGMTGLPTKSLPIDDDEPVAALTLGRLRFARTRPFLRAAAPAERDAVGNQAVVASTAFARLARPRLVSTFSIWRRADAMREYAFAEDGSHQAAVKADRARPFHHESAFIRFRPYASAGAWDGRDPLATL